MQSGVLVLVAFILQCSVANQNGNPQLVVHKLVDDVVGRALQSDVFHKRVNLDRTTLAKARLRTFACGPVASVRPGLAAVARTSFVLHQKHKGLESRLLSPPFKIVNIGSHLPCSSSGISENAVSDLEAKASALEQSALQLRSAGLESEALKLDAKASEYRKQMEVVASPAETEAAALEQSALQLRAVGLESEALKLEAKASAYRKQAEVTPVPVVIPTLSPSHPVTQEATPLHMHVPFSTIYINMGSRPDRCTRIQAQLETIELPALRMEAITGDLATDALVTRSWNSELNTNFDKSTLPANLTMSPGERGCAASHAMLWLEVAKLDDSAPPLLVLEDDATLSLELKEKAVELIHFLTHAVEPAARKMMLYLGGYVPKWDDDVEEAAVGDYKIRDVKYIWQTSSYFIWPAAARELVAALPVDGPVDCFLAKQFLTGRLRGMAVQPFLAHQANPADTDVVHTNLKKSTEQLIRELTADPSMAQNIPVEDIQQVMQFVMKGQGQP